MGGTLPQFAAGRFRSRTERHSRRFGHPVACKLSGLVRPGRVWECMIRTWPRARAPCDKETSVPRSWRNSKSVAAIPTVVGTTTTAQGDAQTSEPCRLIGGGGSTELRAGHGVGLVHLYRVRMDLKYWRWLAFPATTNCFAPTATGSSAMRTGRRAERSSINDPRAYGLRYRSKASPRDVLSERAYSLTSGYNKSVPALPQGIGLAEFTPREASACRGVCS